MSTKINGLEVRTIRVGSSASVSATGKRGAEQSAPGAQPRDADVLITGAARSLAALEARVRDLPAIDAARVADVQKRLDEGRYQVDPQRIADRLLRLEDDLGMPRGDQE
jgi:negative regulator of flagellin synthesis FlgM